LLELGGVAYSIYVLVLGRKKSILTIIAAGKKGEGKKKRGRSAPVLAVTLTGGGNGGPAFVASGRHRNGGRCRLVTAGEKKGRKKNADLYEYS